MTINKCSQLGLGKSAYFLSGNSAVLKQNQGRDAANIELRRNALVFIHVHLGDLEFVTVVSREFFQNRANHLARTAPLSPEVEQYRFVGFEDVLLKRGVCYMFDAGNAYISNKPNFLPKFKT